MGKDATFGYRLKQLREARGLTQEGLAKLSGLARSYIGSLEIGDIEEPGLERLNRLAKGFNMSIGQLNQELYRGKKTTHTPDSHALASELQNILHRMVPIKGAVPAGHPSPQDQETDGFIYATKEGILTNGTFALKVAGDSLIGDKINSGDFVFVQPTTDIEDGGIYILRLENEVVARHVYKSDDCLRLISSNPLYQEMRADQVEILGKVIWSQAPGLSH
jgi:repressor LexA